MGLRASGPVGATGAAAGDPNLGWTKTTIAASALSAAATSEQVAVVTIPANDVVRSVYIKHSSAFTGGGAASCTVSVGLAGNADLLAPAFDIFQAPGATVFQITDATNVVGSGSATGVIAEFTCDINVDQLAAGGGSVDIWVKTEDLP